MSTESNKGRIIEASQSVVKTAGELAEAVGGRIRVEWEITRKGQISKRTPFARKIKYSIWYPIRDIVAPFRD